MKKIIIFFSMCTLGLYESIAQTTFTYDGSGNRLAKVVTGALPQPTVTATPASVGANQASILLAQGCTGGTLTWSTGHLGSSFTAFPCKTETYVVYCKVSACPSQQTSAQVTVIQTSPYTSTILTSEKTGNWNDPSVWCCGRIPTVADDVIIYPNHTVTITDDTAQAKGLGFETAGSKLNFTPVGGLKIGGN